MKKTALYQEHLRLGAKMGAYAGWQMPLRYQSLTTEHHAVRHGCGLFDVGHMGILRLPYPTDHSIYTQNLSLSRPPQGLNPGQIRYARLQNEQGGIIDDLLMYAYSDHLLWVVNAANTESVREHLKQCGIKYKHEQLNILAVQGPQAQGLLARVLEQPLSKLRYYNFQELKYLKQKIIVSRTGYTGEDGFEIVLRDPVQLWQGLLAEQAQPCGLITRDVLRIEAGLPLYGHELLPTMPAATYQLVGLTLEEKNIPRQGMPVFTNKKEIGYITSGTFSPALQKPIAMAYVNKTTAGQKISIRIRDKNIPAKVVSLPFYQRATK
jgi:aminomethyltransferase